MLKAFKKPNSKPQRGETLVSPLGAVAVQKFYKGVQHCNTPYFPPKTRATRRPFSAYLTATPATPPTEAKMNATRFVMDYLRHGPCSAETLCSAGEARGLTREQVVSAASRLGVVCRERTGIWCAFLPDNLSAIWWSDKPHAQHFGNAA
jgi:hypothetical protein